MVFKQDMKLIMYRMKGQGEKRVVGVAGASIYRKNVFREEMMGAVAANHIDPTLLPAMF